MSPNGVVSLHSFCLTALLAVGGAFAFEAGQRQAALALFAAGVCVFVASILTSLIVGRVNAAHRKARADYVERYGEDLPPR